MSNSYVYDKSIASENSMCSIRIANETDAYNPLLYDFFDVFLAHKKFF